MDRVAIDAQRRYQQLVKELQPKPKVVQDVWRAFWVGGAISVVGQALFDLFQMIEPTRGEAAAATLAGLIFLSAVATGLGVYDRLGEYAGMGAAIPITGFANTVVAAAQDFRREGWILGLGCKMFFIAGPVIVYGLLSGLAVTLVRLAVEGLLYGSGRW